MDWQGVGVVVTGVLSVVAIGIGVRGRRETDRLALRLVGALEQMAADRGPQWQLEHLENDAFILTNTGPSTVHRVRIDAAELGIHGLEFEQILPGSSVKFLAVGSLATSDDTVTVEWSPDGGPGRAMTWSRPIPGNPTR
jgi:hypothetical protein